MLDVHPNFLAVLSLATAERWFGHNVDYQNEEEDDNERMIMMGITDKVPFICYDDFVK